MSAVRQAIQDQLAAAVPVIMPLLLSALVALLTYIAVWLKSAAQAVVEAHKQNTLQVAATNAAGIALSDAKKNLTSVDVHPGSRDLDKAVAYMQAAAPEAVSSFKLDDRELAEKVVAKIGILTSPNPQGGKT